MYSHRRSFHLCSMIRHQRGVSSDPDSTLYEQVMGKEMPIEWKEEDAKELTSRVLHFATGQCVGTEATRIHYSVHYSVPGKSDK